MRRLAQIFPEAAEFGRSAAADLPRTKGAYLLQLRVDSALPVRIPRGEFMLEAGDYAYCGSANGPGGIAARVSRHFRSDRRPHWHIDQISSAASALTALTFPGGRECALVARLAGEGATFPVAGFGSSDCRTCTAHLLRLK